MAKKATGASFDDYVMGRTSEEYQRLRRQAAAWEEATRRVLGRAGLRRGMSCLDVGCGPGEVMRLMGEVVGPTGRVTGLDADGRLGREALEVLEAQVDSRFAFVEADVETAEDIEGQPFDLVFGRLVLLHVRDPLALLRKMDRWTRPGGCVVVQDYDFRLAGLYPELPPWKEFERVVFEVLEKTGKDARIGQKLPAYFVEAGIGEPDGLDGGVIVQSFREVNPMLQAVYRSMLPPALQFGLTTEERSRAFFEEMDAQARGIYRAGYWPVLVGVWKRKAA